MTTAIEELTGYLAPSQAAARLGVAEATLRLWAKGGRVPTLVTPTGRLYRVKDIDKIAEQRRGDRNV